MNPPPFPSARLLLLAAATLALAIAPAQARTDSAFYRPLTLAAADTSSSGGGAGVDDEKAQEAELVKQTLNPVASLVSVPIQNNWNFGLGPADAMNYKGKQPISLQLGYRYYAEGPAGGPDWGLRFTVTFLSPK